MLREIIIEYIYHSGFSIKFEDRIFVFDYYKGDLPKIDRPSSIFVSHSHPDHYNPEIFSIFGPHAEDFILSDDIVPYEKEDNIIRLGSQTDVNHLKSITGDHSHFVKPGDLLYIKDFQVKTFGSTDKGVSFLLSYKGINIFHAGDLNLWIWDEDSPEERDAMYRDFMEIIKEVSAYDIDIAFFPLDPRLEDRAADGFNIFIDEVQPSLIFPMHFKDRVGFNLQYMNKFKEYSDIYRPIFKANQIFLVHYEG